MAIWKGIERGFFDEDEIAIQAAQQDERHSLSASEDAIYQAWRQFHDSFDDNAPQVAEAIHSAYTTHMRAVSRGNLDEAVLMFRRLSFAEKASDLIAAFVEFNKENITAVDDPSNPFHPTVKDEEFRAALASVAAPPMPKSIKESLIAMSRGNFGEDDQEAAAHVSVHDFYTLFKGAGLDELSRIVEGSLFWRRFANATQTQKEMTDRVLAA